VCADTVALPRPDAAAHCTCPATPRRKSSGVLKLHVFFSRTFVGPVSSAKFTASTPSFDLGRHLKATSALYARDRVVLVKSDAVIVSWAPPGHHRLLNDGGFSVTGRRVPNGRYEESVRVLEAQAHQAPTLWMRTWFRLGDQSMRRWCCKPVERE
jgi:hypothetical protein